MTSPDNNTPLDGPPAAARHRWTGGTSDDQQSTMPVRIGIALAVGVLLWLGPYLGTVAVLLPNRVAEVAPNNKEAVVALLSTVAMIVATIANIVIGALSDLTRSRWGRRTPWLIVGSIGAAVMLCVLSTAQSVPMLLTYWVIYQIFLNAIVAPLLAVIADRIAPKYRGTISSVYAVGFSVGSYGGTILGAQFLGDVSVGLYVMGSATLLAGPLAALIMREGSSLAMPAKRLTRSMVLENFVFPVRDCRDFYLALAGKLAIVTAKFAIAGFQLYIFVDYIKLNKASVAQYISLISMILLVTALVFSAVSGTISDKIGSRKIPVVVASGLIAVGVLIPAFTPSAWTMVVYAVIAGIGMGVFNSVDQALNIEVLPNPQTAAKDLGILNLAQTGGQILGPVLAAAAVAVAGYRGIFPVSFVLALAGAVLVALIRRVK